MSNYFSKNIKNISLFNEFRTKKTKIFNHSAAYKKKRVVLTLFFRAKNH